MITGSHLATFANTVLRRLSPVLFGVFSTASVFGGPGGVDTTFNVIVNNTVYSVLTQPDGKILIGGAFTTVAGVPRNGLARLFPDGTVDSSFSNSISAGGTVYAMLVQPDGRLLVAGSLNVIASEGPFNQPIEIVNVARLNPDGSGDGTFTNSNPSGPIFALALQTDGKILIGGPFTAAGGAPHDYMARLNSNGSVDGTFGVGAVNGSAVNAIAVQSDGNILIGGSFSSFQTYGVTNKNLARLTTNGVPDPSYAPSTDEPVQSVFLQGDGKSLWGGSFHQLGSKQCLGVGRLNANGANDSGWDSEFGAIGTVYAVTEDANGNIYAGGTIRDYGLSASGFTIRVGVARIFPGGTLDTSFNNTTNFPTPQIRCLALQSDGKVLAGGNFTSFNSFPRTNLVRLYGDNYPAEIIAQPRSQNVMVGTSVTFSVEVSNPTTVYYQWLKNGVDIPGATDSEYSLFNVQPSDDGNYSVFASTSLGGTTSSNALLAVGIPPQTVQQHLNLDRSFTLQMPGTPGFSYVLQTATNLTPPIVWQNVASNQTGTNGVWTYVDTNTPVGGSRYYRVAAP